MSAFLLLLRLLSHTDQHTCTWSQPSGQDVRTTLLQPPMSWPLTPLPVTQPHQLVLSTQVAFPYSFSTEERRSRRIYYALGCKYIMWPEKHNPLYYNISAKTVQLRNLWSCCLYCFYNSVRTINADWFGLAIIEFKWQYVQQNPYNVLIKLVGCLVFCCFGEYGWPMYIFCFSTKVQHFEEVLNCAKNAKPSHYCLHQSVESDTSCWTPGIRNSCLMEKN